MWHIILSIVLALMFAITGGGKVLGLPASHRQRELLHLGRRFWLATGILEWAAIVGLIVGIWVPILGILAACGLVLLMAGAIVSRLRAAQLPGPAATGVQRLAISLPSDVLVALIAVATAVLTALNR